MIGISTKIFDFEGADIFFDVDIQDLNNKIQRRVASTPTLDGGSYVSDQGYSDSDKLLSFKISNLTRARAENLIRIAKYHSRIIVTMNEGAFEGIIHQIYYLQGELVVNITVVGVA